MAMITENPNGRDNQRFLGHSHSQVIRLKHLDATDFDFVKGKSEPRRLQSSYNSQQSCSQLTNASTRFMCPALSEPSMRHHHHSSHAHRTAQSADQVRRTTMATMTAAAWPRMSTSSVSSACTAFLLLQRHVHATDRC